jgi:hypothetical protein
MKKKIKLIGVIFLSIVIGIQIIPTSTNKQKEIVPNDFIKTFAPPEQISYLLKNSCYDCHSNNTDYPWYNNLQPIGWYMEEHIKEAKNSLNFSEFNAYSNRKKRSKIKSIISQIKDDEMPLSSYTFIHTHAKLSEKEKSDLEIYFNQLTR